MKLDNDKAISDDIRTVSSNNEASWCDFIMILDDGVTISSNNKPSSCDIETLWDAIWTKNKENLGNSYLMVQLFNNLFPPSIVNTSATRLHFKTLL